MAKSKFMTKNQIDSEIDRLSTLREDQEVQIVDFVDSLGDTASKIAGKLRRRGIKAVPGNARKCALAVALTRQFGVEDVAVKGSSNIRVDGYEVHALNHEAVSEFIDKFDGGDYPALVKKKKK